MARFFCVYYTATTLKKINKKNKKVVIIDTDNPNVLSTPTAELKINKNIKYIAYIREMGKDVVNFRDNTLREKELENNKIILQKIKDNEATREDTNIS